MDKPFGAKYRKRQLAAVKGETQEISVGTGLNRPHYPAQVRKIATVDLNPGMNKRLSILKPGGTVAVAPKNGIRRPRIRREIAPAAIMTTVCGH